MIKCSKLIRILYNVIPITYYNNIIIEINEMKMYKLLVQDNIMLLILITFFIF